MINKAIIGAAVGIAIVAGTWFHGHSHGKKTERLIWQTKTTESVLLAVEAERTMQQGVNDAIKRQYDDLAGINVTLNADLDRLRQRPERPAVPTTSRADCEGANGPELAREYAGFLARYAAKAAKQDAALATCYAVIDSLPTPPHLE